MARMTLQKMIEQERDSCPALDYEFQISDPKRRTDLDLQAELVVNMDEENSLGREFKLKADRTVPVLSILLMISLLSGVYSYLNHKSNGYAINGAIAGTAICAGAKFVKDFINSSRYNSAYKRAMRRDAQSYYRSLDMR